MHVVSVQTSNERGGGEYANVDLLQGLSEHGVRVCLLTNFPELAQGTDVPVRQIDLGPKLGRSTVVPVALNYPRYLGRMLSALRAETKDGPADAVLLHYKKEQLMSRFVTRRLAKRVVWAEWGPLPFEFRTGLPRAAYLASARCAEHIVAISEGTRRTLIDAGVPAAKISVIPNLVDVATLDFDPAARERLRADWGAGEGTFVVGCIARFHHKKRNDVLIDAFDHLPTGADILLVMAGSGPDEDALRARAERHGARIRFEPTPRGYVEQVLSACDVQVFAPSPTEGAPRSIILGQVVARPVIATDAEGASDLIPPNTGTIVSPPHDAAALAAVLEAYRSDPERRAREGAAGRAYALERYDTERTLDAFTAVLAGRPGG